MIFFLVVSMDDALLDKVKYNTLLNEQSLGCSHHHDDAAFMRSSTRILPSSSYSRFVMIVG